MEVLLAAYLIMLFTAVLLPLVTAVSVKYAKKRRPIRLYTERPPSIVESQYNIDVVYD